MRGTTFPYAGNYLYEADSSGPIKWRMERMFAGSDELAAVAVGGAVSGSEFPERELLGCRSAVRAWTFFTNHLLVLACVAANPDVRVRDIAAWVGITERATQSILVDLDAAGYIERHQVGRRNHYLVRLGGLTGHRGTEAKPIGRRLGLLVDTVFATSAPAAAWSSLQMPIGGVS
jgi:hypothetical protein